MEEKLILNYIHIEVVELLKYQIITGMILEMKVMVIPIVIVLIALVTAAGSLPAIRMILRLRPAEVLHGSKT